MKEKGVIPSRNVTSSLDVARQFVRSLPDGALRVRFEHVLSRLSAGHVSDVLAELKTVSPLEFEGHGSYFTFSQFRALVSKVPYSVSDCDRRARAIASFWKAERKCGRVNRRLRYFSSHKERMPEHVRVILSRAQSYIRQRLGKLTDGKMTRIYAEARPGPGLTLGTWNRFRTGGVHKYYSTDWTVSAKALPEAMEFLRRNPGILYHAAPSDYVPRMRSAEANRVGFVPKDGLTLRSIAVEPNLNMMLQLGVHEYLVDVLRDRCGVNLRSQDLNQAFAYLGSRGGRNTFVTLDLSAASDSVSTELVRWLLPRDWFSLLDTLRSERFTLDGEEHVSQKFSTMGNGFTFALESLIFRALAHGVCSYFDECENVVIYGDDIIVHQSVALALTEVLGWCGFAINTSKSYYFGPFRESCGADWHGGIDVTPVYLREERLDVRSVNQVINSWTHKGSKDALRRFLVGRLRSAGNLLMGLENEDLGSCVFGGFDYLKSSGYLKYRKRWQTYVFKGWCETGLEDTSLPPYLRYLSSLLSGVSGVNLRGRTKVRRRWLTPGRKVRGWVR